jgi:methyl-accepting chemotaxis protein
MRAITKKREFTIARRMIIYLLIILFTVITLGIEFLVEVNDVSLKEGFAEDIIGNNNLLRDDKVISPLAHLRNKVILLLFMQVLVTGVVMAIFVKKITLPLKKMFEVSSYIAGGDLKEPMPVYLPDEIGRMGEFINDLVSHFGELVGHIRVSVSSELDALSNIKGYIEKRDEVSAYREIEALGENIAQLKDMIKDFKLYEVETHRSGNSR